MPLGEIYTPRLFIDYHTTNLKAELNKYDIQINKLGVIGYFLNILGNMHYDSKQYVDMLFKESFVSTAWRDNNLYMHAHTYGYNPLFANTSVAYGEFVFDFSAVLKNLIVLNSKDNDSVERTEIVFKAITFVIEDLVFRCEGLYKFVREHLPNGTYKYYGINYDSQGRMKYYPSTDDVIKVPFNEVYQYDLDIVEFSLPNYNFREFYPYYINLDNGYLADLLVNIRRSGLYYDEGLNQWDQLSIETVKYLANGLDEICFIKPVNTSSHILEFGSGDYGIHVPNSDIQLIQYITQGDSGNLNLEKRIPLSAVDMEATVVTYQKRIYSTSSLISDTNETILTSAIESYQQLFTVEFAHSEGGTKPQSGKELRQSIIEYIQSKEYLMDEKDFYNITNNSVKDFKFLFKKSQLMENNFYLHKVFRDKYQIPVRTTNHLFKAIKPTEEYHPYNLIAEEIELDNGIITKEQNYIIIGTDGFHYTNKDLSELVDITASISLPNNAIKLTWDCNSYVTGFFIFTRITPDNKYECYKVYKTEFIDIGSQLEYNSEYIGKFNLFDFLNNSFVFNPVFDISLTNFISPFIYEYDPNKRWFKGYLLKDDFIAYPTETNWKQGFDVLVKNSEIPEHTVPVYYFRLKYDEPTNSTFIQVKSYQDIVNDVFDYYLTIEQLNIKNLKLEDKVFVSSFGETGTSYISDISSSSDKDDYVYSVGTIIEEDVTSYGVLLKSDLELNLKQQISFGNGINNVSFSSLYVGEKYIINIGSYSISDTINSGLICIISKDLILNTDDLKLTYYNIQSTNSIQLNHIKNIGTKTYIIVGHMIEDNDYVPFILKCQLSDSTEGNPELTILSQKIFNDSQSLFINDVEITHTYDICLVGKSYFDDKWNGYFAVMNTNLVFLRQNSIINDLNTIELTNAISDDNDMLYVIGHETTSLSGNGYIFKINYQTFSIDTFNHFLLYSSTHNNKLISLDIVNDELYLTGHNISLSSNASELYIARLNKDLEIIQQKTLSGNTDEISLKIYNHNDENIYIVGYYNLSSVIYGLTILIYPDLSDIPAYYLNSFGMIWSPAHLIIGSSDSLNITNEYSIDDSSFSLSTLTTISLEESIVYYLRGGSNYIFDDNTLQYIYDGSSIDYNSCSFKSGSLPFFFEYGSNIILVKSEALFTTIALYKYIYSANDTFMERVRIIDKYLVEDLPTGSYTTDIDKYYGVLELETIYPGSTSPIDESGENFNSEGSNAYVCSTLTTTINNSVGLITIPIDIELNILDRETNNVIATLTSISVEQVSDITDQLKLLTYEATNEDDYILNIPLMEKSTYDSDPLYYKNLINTYLLNSQYYERRMVTDEVQFRFLNSYMIPMDLLNYTIKQNYLISNSITSVSADPDFIVDNLQNFEVDSLIGRKLRIKHVIDDQLIIQDYTILSNTSDTIYIKERWDIIPSEDLVYEVHKSLYFPLKVYIECYVNEDYTNENPVDLSAEKAKMHKLIAEILQTTYSGTRIKYYNSQLIDLIHDSFLFLKSVKVRVFDSPPSGINTLEITNGLETKKDRVIIDDIMHDPSIDNVVTKKINYLRYCPPMFYWDVDNIDISFKYL